MAFKAPKIYMVNHPMLGMGEGNNGYFRFERDGITYNCIASDGAGWEHVSVSLNKKRCPTWDEMCTVKMMFWDDPEDIVVQYHPPKRLYVNNHPYCLHLWRFIDFDMPVPPRNLVGF